MIELKDQVEADRLIDFARINIDGVYLAVVLDVIVSAQSSGTGLGGLAYSVINHPAIANVRVWNWCASRMLCLLSALGVH